MLTPLADLHVLTIRFRSFDIVRETSEDGWLHGRLERTGEEGLFPDNYVELIYVDIEVKNVGGVQV